MFAESPFCAIVTGNPDCSVCDPATGGCIPSFTADMDGDLHASISCGGDDCDDTNFEIYPGRVEECDPGMLDSNCDPSDEPTTNTWYADCDDDGYAPADAAVVTGCVAPTVTPTCRSWTSRVPAGTTSTDCHDGNPDVRPNQTLFFPTAYTTPSGGSSFDYNCNGTNNPEYADAADPTMVSCGGGITGCDARPPAALFQRGIACGTSATLYTCEDYRTACRRTASAMSASSSARPDVESDHWVRRPTLAGSMSPSAAVAAVSLITERLPLRNSHSRLRMRSTRIFAHHCALKELLTFAWS